MNPTAVLMILSFATFSAAVATTASGGHWDLLQASIGVSAMHMQLLRNDRVIIFDRTDFGKSNLSLPNAACRNDPTDQALKLDCTAHSVEYNVPTNAFRPLTILTDTWCSSATVSPDGRLVQTGGFNDGDRAVRTFSPNCDADVDVSSCDWTEINPGLHVRRWYATNQILPDGRAFIVGGRRQFNYEFYPSSAGAGIFDFSFLRQTHDVEENNLYPFVHLNVDGNLFIFANNRAILFNYVNNTVVRTYPEIPGGDPRNYPSSGSSVLLPLKPSAAMEAEVMVCGGAPKGSYNQASKNKTFISALSTCGRIRITDPSPSWSMESMPMGRVMGDMVLVPTGQVMIINGAAAGSAGWELGQDPVLSPVLYSPDAPSGAARFSVQRASGIPRLYHSSVVLLRDGRLLVGGSNPHIYYNFTGVRYPTELSLEAFSPGYLDVQFSPTRPKITTAAMGMKYGELFTVRFTVGTALSSGGGVMVTMVAPSFSTHSFSMNQRLLILDSKKVTAVGPGAGYEVLVVAPASGVLAPSGYYMLFVVNDGIPSEGVWVHIQ